ncbi:MAG: EamA family transporter RarD [Parasphingorhabdus sp.]|nr:EamA family transporter RarD [Parasphingorhabdus sp.]
MQPPQTDRGLAQALTASVMWGLMPFYYKQLTSVPALETVAHRILWSVPLLFMIVHLRGSMPDFFAAVRNPKIRLALIGSAVCIAGNWLLYIWAVNTDHVVAASLGYFLSPLLSVLLGRIMLSERLSPLQSAAVVVAAIGVSALALQAWQTLWISVGLASFWAFYSLIRKIAPVGPMVGLTIETGVLLVPALGYAIWIGRLDDGVGFGTTLSINLLLVGSAIVTAAPLLLFAAAVKKMRLSTIGLLQYVAPSIQFALGVLLYREPLTLSHIICFSLIWLSLMLFSWDMLRADRAAPAASTPT